MNIEDEIKSIVSRHFGIDPESLSRSTSFIFDLRADSLDLVELIISLEESLGIIIPEDEAEKISNIGDVVECVRKKLKERS